MEVYRESLTNNRRILVGLGLALALAFLFIVAMTLFVQLTGNENPYSGKDISVFLFLGLYTVVTYFFIIRFGINKIGRLSLREIGWSVKSWPKEIAIGLVGAFAAVTSFYLYLFVTGLWSLQEFYDLPLQYSSDQRLVFLLIGLSAAFIEESLFRGYLQPALSRRFGIVIGILMTSIVFALYHLQFRPFAFAGKLILGIVFGVLRGRDNSLVRPAIAHAGTWFILGSA